MHHKRVLVQADNPYGCDYDRKQLLNTTKRRESAMLRGMVITVEHTE